MGAASSTEALALHSDPFRVGAHSDEAWTFCAIPIELDTWDFSLF
jgi:hypothetical protein